MTGTVDDEVLSIVREAIVQVIGNNRLRIVDLDDVKLRDLGLDSAGMLELAGVLEERFQCEISDNELSRVTRIEDLVRLVRGQ